DLHWTTSDTGWAKAAYGVLFGPWMHGVPVFMFNGRFDPERQLDLLARYEVSVFCTPPTEYRLLVKQDLKRRHLPRLRHCTGAGAASGISPAIAPAATRTATSGSSGAPTTSSSRPATASAPSRWRARSSSTRRWSSRPWWRAPTRCAARS